MSSYRSYDSAPGAARLSTGQTVDVDVAGRHAVGTILDIDWRPTWNAQQSTAVTVDVGETTVVVSPDDVWPR
jgi:carbohydrate-selective porin OprB